jgi:hypothetical protein
VGCVTVAPILTRDAQELARHSSLATTQRYIQGDSDANRKVVAPI